MRSGLLGETLQRVNSVYCDSQNFGIYKPSVFINFHVRANPVFLPQRSYPFQDIKSCVV